MNKTNTSLFDSIITLKRLPDLLVIGGVSFVVFYLYTMIVNDFHYSWQWGKAWNYVIFQKDGQWMPNIILQGLFRTLGISFWSLIFSSIIGFFLAMMGLSKISFLRWFSVTYVELIRGIPPLVLIFFGYFILGNNLAVNYEEMLPEPVFAFLVFWAGGEGVVDNYVIGVICLTILEAAFITEIFRAGIRSIGQGQWEAGRSLGLGYFRIFREIIFPQAWRKILPPLTGQYISLVKDSSIISVVSIPELTFSGIEVGVSSSRVFETWIIVAGFYLMICLSISKVMGFIEKKVRL